MIDALALTLLILAGWRLSHLLAHETGPFALLDRLRFYAGAYPAACEEQRSSGSIANVLCCLNCLSLWIAPVILLAWFYAPVVVWVLAVSAGAILVQRIIR